MSKKVHLSEAERMIPWLQLPITERSALSEKDAELLERWNVADNLYREHMSERKILPMLMEKFGYSESTARRDVDCARRVWGTRPRADKDYLANMLVDYLTETMVKAGKDRKYGEVARLADVILKAAGIGKKEEEALTDEELRRPMMLLPVYSPEQVGGRLLTQEQRDALMTRLLKPKRDAGIAEADYEEMPDGPAD